MQAFNITLCLRSVPNLQRKDGKVIPFHNCENSMRNYIGAFLNEAGYHITHVTSDKPFKIDSKGVVLIIGNANWYPNIYRQLKSLPEFRRPSVILWHTEPLPLPKNSGFPCWPRLHLWEIKKILLRDAKATDPYSNYFRLQRMKRKKLFKLLVVSTQSRCEFLKENGIPASWIPLGYEPSYGHNMDLCRDIDVLFLGNLAIARRKRLVKRLLQLGINLETMGSWYDPTFWGENRTRLLNRTKIFLNFPRFPGDFSGSRLILGMANNALVISEPMYKPAPFIPGKHYISASIEEMPKFIDYYLSNKVKREQISMEGHQFIIHEVTMKSSVSHLLKLIENMPRDPFE